MKNKLFLGLVLVMGLTSCDDFLDETPESTRTTAVFYRTQADFYNALVGSYSGLKLPGLYANGSGALMTLMEVASDNTTITSPRSPVNNSPFEIDDLNFTQSNTVIRDAWRDHYIAIGRVNNIIARLPAANFPVEIKNRFDAESRFLRALFYFNLVRLYGDVQLITEPVNDPFGVSTLPRAPKEEVYQLIIDDLNIAYNVLPAINAIPATESGRASRWAARALLGKVYIAMGQYDQAIPVLRDVNDNSGRSLMADFRQVFAGTTPYAANTEYIFAVQYKSGLLAQGANAVGTQGGVETTQGSDMWSNWTPPNSGFLLGPNGGSGGGFNSATPSLVAAFEPGDKRKELTVSQIQPLSPTTSRQALYSVKFRQDGAIGGDSDTDFPILRLADVILMYAEALNEQGQTADALVQFNRVHAHPRTGLSPLLNLSQAQLRLAIEQERRVELAFENQRWPDLVRTGRYLPVMRAHGKPVQEFFRLYPIPQRETDLNSALVQNPGY